MGDFLQRMGMKAVFGAAGVVAMLGWWTLTGGGGGDVESRDDMPAVVFEGGRGELSFDFESNQTTVLKASFSRWAEDEEDEEGIEVEKRYEPGRWIEIVEVPDDTYIYVEIGVPDATPGATLDWTVEYDGRELIAEQIALDEPLRDGYAFFVQFEADSVEDLGDWLASR